MLDQRESICIIEKTKMQITQDFVPCSGRHIVNPKNFKKYICNCPDLFFFLICETEPQKKNPQKSLSSMGQVDGDATNNYAQQQKT